MAHFTVIGLGTFGITVSLELIRLGHTVTGIDSSEKIAELYAEKLAQTVICDATDERALKELELSSSEAVLVAIGEDMQASLLATLNLKKMGIKNLWVKANTAAHHTILNRLNVPRIIHPEEETGIRVAHILGYSMVNDYLSLGHGYHVVEVHITEKFAGLSLKQFLGSEYEHIQVLLLKREEAINIHPDLTVPIEKNDIVLFCGTGASLKHLAAKLGL